MLPSSAGGLPEGLATRVDGHLARFAEHLREGLLAASVGVGLEVMDELMAAEVTELVDPRGDHQRARAPTRHRTERGRVSLGGRRLPIQRPRVRTADGTAEVPLASYRALTGSDLLAEGIVARMLAGLSTRRYGAGLEPVGAGAEARSAGTSRSAVSRRFVAATGRRLGELLSRPLDGQRFLVVYLGVVTDLRDRGLDASAGILFAIDRCAPARRLGSRGAGSRPPGGAGRPPGRGAASGGWPGRTSPASTSRRGRSGGVIAAAAQPAPPRACQRCRRASRDERRGVGGRDAGLCTDVGHHGRGSSDDGLLLRAVALLRSHRAGHPILRSVLGC